MSTAEQIEIELEKKEKKEKKEKEIKERKQYIKNHFSNHLTTGVDYRGYYEPSYYSNDKEKNNCYHEFLNKDSIDKVPDECTKYYTEFDKDCVKRVSDKKSDKTGCARYVRIKKNQSGKRDATVFRTGGKTKRNTRRSKKSKSKSYHRK